MLSLSKHLAVRRIGAFFATLDPSTSLRMTVWVGHPHPKRKPIRSVLIHGLCIFEDGTRAATAASKSSVGLEEKYENAWRSVA